MGGGGRPTGLRAQLCRGDARRRGRRRQSDGHSDRRRGGEQRPIAHARLHAASYGGVATRHARHRSKRRCVSCLKINIIYCSKHQMY